MWSVTFGSLFMCEVVSLAMAGRSTMQFSSIGNLAAADFGDVVKKMHSVDWHKDTDRFTVFETDGAKLVEVVSPEPSACSVEALKKVLLDCPPRGKICIALYKFNYPRAVGSSTLKSRSVLMSAQDKPAMGKALGGFFGATKVSMGFTNFVWNSLKNELSKAQVSPSLSLELSDNKDITDLGGDTIWDKLKTSVGRIGDTEEESFKKHVIDTNAKAAGTPAAPIASSTTATADDDSKPNEAGTNAMPVQSAQPPASVAAPVDIKKITKEVEEAVSNSFEKIARKTAREEVGRAIRKLGTDIGEATRNVGVTWLDKSRT